MSVVRMLVFAFLLGAMLLNAQVPGELEIVNAGFETGDLSGWNLWPGDDPKVSIVADMVASGDNAAKISGGTGAFYKIVTNDVTLAHGTVYVLAAKALLPSGDALQEGQSVYLAGKAITPAGEVWFESAKVLTSADSKDIWHRLYCGLQYPDDATELTLEFKWTGTGADDPGSVYVDEVKVIRMETPENIINLGFEDTEDSLYNWQGGWGTWAYLPVEPPVGEETWFETGVSRSGGRSLAIVPQDWSMFSDDWWWGGYYSWTSQAVLDTVDYYEEGDNFYMSAWLMSAGPDPVSGDMFVDLELTFKDINGENLSNLGYTGARVWSEAKINETTLVDEWHFLEVYIQCPTIKPEHTVTRMELNVRLFQTGDAWGVVYVDDVYMGRGTPAPSHVEHIENRRPHNFSLSQNYPNPFNPKTTINYSIRKKSHVELAVYNVLGEKVAEIVNHMQEAGTHSARFNAAGLPSGTYFYTLKTEDQTVTRKMLLLR